MNFDDIKIIDLDVEETRKSRKAAGMREMCLKLSDAPDAVWVQFFKKERAFPRHTMWRDAWIEDDYIVIDCVPSEIEQYHLDDLKTDVKKSNEKFRLHLQRAESQAKREDEAEKKELEELLELKKSLNFD